MYAARPMTDDDRIEAFVRRFADFWADPRPERMGELLTEDVVLRQPLAPPMHGLPAAQEEFRRIFSWLSDLRGAGSRDYRLAEDSSAMGGGIGSFAGHDAPDVDFEGAVRATPPSVGAFE